MEDFKILSYDEEKLLSKSDLREYYYFLKEYLKNQESTKYEVQERLNKSFTRTIVDKIKGYDLIISGEENIPTGPVIYASTHQDFHDHFNVVLAIPDHAIILNTSTVTPLFKIIMSINGIKYVDREDEDSRFNSKLDLMKIIASGKSVVVFPEATWNCSPNKFHLPIHKGIFDMARKMQVPIVPLVQEYNYNPSKKGITNVNSCHVHFGKPIYVSLNDSFNDKVAELSESWSTIRYSLYEEKGLFTRKLISNQEYINSVLARIKGWGFINVSIDDERKQIYGYDDEFWDFHHINDVSFNKNGELLPTKEIQRLMLINEQHIYN